MQINSTVLREISIQVSRGNHTWGLLLANEYLPPESPLRRALVAKAAGRDENISNLPNGIQTSIEAGAKAGQLPAGWQELIGSRAVVNPRKVPQMRPYRIDPGNRRRSPGRSTRKRECKLG